MTTAESQDLQQLRRLLQGAVHDPLQEVARLHTARTRVAGQDPVAREMLEADARFLRSHIGGDRTLADAMADVDSALARLRDRCWRAAPSADVEVLFELAEARASAGLKRDEPAVQDYSSRITTRCRQMADWDRICQEADERWAALTASDEMPLSEQVARLRSVAAMLKELATVAAAPRSQRMLRRRARRATRAADDRELGQRQEELLGRSGVSAMENTSFALLVLVLVLLLVEASVALAPSTLHAMHWVDGIACLFFVVEFGFKLALAPRRGSWFLRYAVTDLLPAIPAALFLLPIDVSSAADDTVVVRLLRLIRIAWLARYVQAMRPLLAPIRLALLLVRGMDGLVRRFPALLDRNFVFFADADEGPLQAENERGLLFQVLRREHSLLVSLPEGARREVLHGRMLGLAVAADSLGGSWRPTQSAVRQRRDVPVERAVEFLYALTPGELAQHLPAGDVRALDRVVRVIRTWPVCWFPILRRFVVDPMPATAEERVVALGRRVAQWLQGWQDKLEFVADMHGIVTGPQILDRVAGAMVKASQRPAVRLLLFGGLFLLFDLLIPKNNILTNIVGVPLVVLGVVGLVVLAVGMWLKRIAGQASDSFRMTSEASFLSLLELTKERTQRDDLCFLARRVFGGLLPAETAAAELGVRVARAHGDERESLADVQRLPGSRRREFERTAMLYLHFLDGAILHETDVKTTEQLLANLSLENLRRTHLGLSQRDSRRLWRLRLDDGSVLRGPFLWFRFITESIAVETAKRITEYNRKCVPLRQRASLTEAQAAEYAAWLDKRSNPQLARTLQRMPPPAEDPAFRTTEFHALHFLGVRRDAEVAEVFGEDVLAALRQDRRNMIREVFGMRPLQRMPRTARSFNAWRFYWARLSHGRVLLLPLFSCWWFVRSVAWSFRRVAQVASEVLRPALAAQRRERGEAAFDVAMRKIHRMKAPGLLEAISMRVRLDPIYSGAPAGWSGSGTGFDVEEPSQLERDLDFLSMRERERAELRDEAGRVVEAVAQLHSVVSWLPALDTNAGSPNAGEAETTALEDAELAVTVAWITDRGAVRTLFTAEHWQQEELPLLLERGAEVGWFRRLRWALSDRLKPHATTRWLRRQGLPLAPQQARTLRAEYASGGPVRRLVDATLALRPDVTPREAAVELMRAAHAHGDEVRRELTALRAVQTLSVLDVRNYRALVFGLGGYADDGEDIRLAEQLP